VPGEREREIDRERERKRKRERERGELVVRVLSKSRLGHVVVSANI
jgi:hypothetical protein